ncbi:MAG: histidine kinase [Solirubrobacterales bacterium]
MPADVMATGGPADLTGLPPVDRALPAPRLALGGLRVPALALVTATVALLALAEVGLVLSQPAPGPRWALVLVPAVAGVYLVAGAVAWQRRPGNRTGPLIVAGAVVWVIAGAVNTTAAPLVAAGLIAATVPFAVVVHLLHGFPSGRLRGWRSVGIVAAGYVVCVLMQAPLYLFGEGPATLLQIADRPDLADAGRWAQWAVGSCVMAATAILLERRRRAMAPARRHGMAPLLAYGIGAVLFVPISGQVAVVASASPDAVLALVVAQLAVLAGVPVAFLAALRRGGFPRTTGLANLATWLGTAPADRVDVAARLADALGDPSVQVAFWLPDPGVHVDLDGRPVALPPPGSERGIAAVRVGGRRVGAIVYDARLLGEPAEVAAAAGVVALAFDHLRLTAELRASRVRIVEAADGERRRIARDLHDGLQAQLVLLAMEADRLGDEADALRGGLRTAIGELRELAQGVMPAVLTERGLGEAVEELAARLPLAVRCDVEPLDPRPPAAVESTAYFVVSEALANTLKHADAGAVRVAVAARGDALVVEVSDDGAGGARPGGGTGLRCIAARVEALGGRLAVDRAPGRGTRVHAELPCGW